MKKTNPIIVTLAASILFTSVGGVFAQDWPQWRGPNRDGKVSGFTAPEKWPSEFTQNWKIAVGAGDATPALVGGKLYVFARQGGDEVTVCLNAADGKEIWQDKYAAQAVSGPAARHPGPRSSPAVADGKVVTLGAAGVLSCLDAATGKMIWRKDEFPKVVPRFFTAYSPVIVDGMAIAHLGGAGNGALMAFDLATGEVKWKWAAEGPDYASPALLTVDGVKQVVTLTEKSAVGVAVADGKLLWEVPFVARGMDYNAATPIIEGQTVIITGAGRGTKALKIEKQGDKFAANELWSNPQLAPQFNTPVLKDGFLYGLSNRGNLYCINAQNGQTAWTDSNRYSGFGSILDAGSCLLALTEKAGLIVFKPSDKEFSELAKVKVADTDVYAHPVVAGNRVFVKAGNSVSLMTISTSVQ